MACVFVLKLDLDQENTNSQQQFPIQICSQILLPALHLKSRPPVRDQSHVTETQLLSSQHA